MLATILQAIGGSLIGRIFGSFETIMQAYFNKEISAAEAQSRLLQALVGGATEVEKANADSLAKTYDSFMQHGMKYREVRALWVAVTASQLVVLLWHQIGIPFVVFMAWTGRDAAGRVIPFPSSGNTVEWAYALLAACLGFGVMMQRSGPGASYLDRFKALIGK